MKAPRATHLPLYRQSQIFAREGIDLGRSTLTDWVGTRRPRADSFLPGQNSLNSLSLQPKVPVMQWTCPPNP